MTGTARDAAFTLFHDLDALMDLSTREERLRRKARSVVGPNAVGLWQAAQGRDLGALLDLLGQPLG